MLSLYVPFRNAIMVLRKFVYIALTPFRDTSFMGVSFLVENFYER